MMGMLMLGYLWIGRFCWVVRLSMMISRLMIVVRMG